MARTKPNSATNANTAVGMDKSIRKSRPSPDKLAASGTEHGIQTAFFVWLSKLSLNILARNPTSTIGYALKYMHAIPSGGARSKATAGMMKAEGVKTGIADTFLPYPIMHETIRTHGLYIEFKRPEFRNRPKLGMSDDQIEFAKYCHAVGYAHIVCFTWREAAREVIHYLHAWHMAEVFPMDDGWRVDA